MTEDKSNKKMKLSASYINYVVSSIIICQKVIITLSNPKYISTIKLYIPLKSSYVYNIRY